MFSKIAMFLIITTLCGCALISSTEAPLLQKSDHTTTAYYFLPKGRIRVQVLKGNGNYDLKYVETNIIPDESNIILLAYNNSALSDDSLTIQLTPDGLLKKVDTSAEDKSGEIIIKFAEVGKEVLKAAAAFPSAVGESPEIIQDITFSPSELDQTNEFISKITSGILRIDLVFADSVSSQISKKEDSCTPSSGICFRPQIPYKLSFYKNNILIQQRIILLPDCELKVCMPIDRAAFVKKITNLTFDKGILTEVHIEKPSELLGFMSIPVSIAKTIASVPAEILQIKINYSGKEKELAEARKNELAAKQALLEYQKKIREENENKPSTNTNPLDNP